MKFLRRRLAVVFTAVVIAACAGMSSFAAAEEDALSPILYAIEKAEEGEEYLHLNDAPVPEEVEKPENEGEQESADKEGDSAETESSSNAATGMTTEYSSTIEPDNNAGTLDKIHTTPANTHSLSRHDETGGLSVEDNTSGNSQSENSQPENPQSENSEPENSQSEEALSEKAKSEKVLVVGIPGDGSYDKFGKIIFTVRLRKADNALKTAEVDLSQLTPVKTNKGRYYILRYGLENEQLDEFSADGIYTSDGESQEASDEEQVVHLETERGKVVEKKFPWVIVIVLAVVVIAVAAAAVFFLLRNGNKPANKGSKEETKKLSPNSELRILESTDSHTGNYYRFELKDRAMVKLNDLTNVKDGRKMESLKGTDLENIAVQAYGNELTVMKLTNNHEEKMFVLNKVQSIAKIECGEKAFRFIWIPGIKNEA